MNEVSGLWLENQQRQLTGEALVEVSYDVSDPNISVERITPENPGVFSEEMYLTDGKTATPYATLEKNLWLLDGSAKTLPGNLQDKKYSGYTGGCICGENGAFEEKQAVVIEFKDSSEFLIPGLTISWGTVFGEYPERFTISAFDNCDEKIGEKTFDNNRSSVSIVEHTALEFELKNCKRIVITIEKWNAPFRRARVEGIFLGINKVYTKRELMSFSESREVSPLSLNLPKYEVMFSIANLSGEFDPDNERGLSAYMMRRQRITTRFGYKLDNSIEWIPGGVYYLSEWTAPEKGVSATFKARDALGLLQNEYFQGTFPSESGASLYDLAKNVIAAAGLVDFEIDDSLKNIVTSAPLPVCSAAECLQLIANAACCELYFKRSGTLCIKRAENPYSEININDDISYSRPQTELSKPIKQFDVSVCSYVSDGKNTGEGDSGAMASADKSKLYAGTLKLAPGENEVVIKYSETADDIDILYTENGVLLSESGAGIVADKTQKYAAGCRLVINNTSGRERTVEVRIYGIPVKCTEKIIAVDNAQPSGEIKTIKNVLITDDDRAKAVGAAVKGVYGGRKAVSFDWRADPRLDVLELVTTPGSARGGDVQKKVLITSSSLSFNGAFKGKCKGVVIE